MPPQSGDLVYKRIGSFGFGVYVSRHASGIDPDANRELLRDLCGTMVYGSLCAMGGMTPFPVLSVLNYFSEDL